MAKRGISSVAVSFGFTPDAPHLNDVGFDTVSIADVPSFIVERERSKGFRLGLYDCGLSRPDLMRGFSSADDRDVPVASGSAELLDSMRAHWRAKAFNVYPNDLNKSA